VNESAKPPKAASIEIDEATPKGSAEPEPSVPALMGGAIPVLPLRDVVVYPHMVIPLFVGREKSIHALDAAMQADKRIMLVAQKQADVDDPKLEDLHGFGTVATILQLLKLPDGTVKVLVEGLERARVVQMRLALPAGVTSHTHAYYAAEIAVEADLDQYDEREMDVLVRSVVSQSEK